MLKILLHAFDFSSLFPNDEDTEVCHSLLHYSTTLTLLNVLMVQLPGQHVQRKHPLSASDLRIRDETNHLLID